MGPYRPRFLAAADFLGCFTHGKGEKTCCLGVEVVEEASTGVEGEYDMSDLDKQEDKAGVEGHGVLYRPVGVDMEERALTELDVGRRDTEVDGTGEEEESGSSGAEGAGEVHVL